MRLKMPQIIRVNLIGKLKAGCSAKDVILEMLRRNTVKGGAGGKVLNTPGPGTLELEVEGRE